MSLKACPDPDALVDAGHRFNRLMSGLQIKYHAAGNWTWPYLEGGKGDTVILLHGYGADKDRFGSFLPLIRRACHVVVPDVPGFGEHRQNWKASYDIVSQTRRLAQFIEGLGLENFHLIGISLGGYLAAHYAAQYPDGVKSLCLMDSAGFSSPVSSDALHLFVNNYRNIFLPNTGPQMQVLMDHLLHNSVKLPSILRRYWLQQVLELLPWRKKLFEDLLSGGIDLMDDLAWRISIPTLVVWGAQDRICHVSTVNTIMERIDDCRSFIIDGCGHIPIVEYPLLSSRIYLNFLREVGDMR